MEPTDPGSEAFVPTPATPRFKVWDALVVLLVGQLLGAGIGLTIGYGITGDESGEPGAFTFACGFVGLCLGYGLSCWGYCRYRGTGSLRRDLGLTVRLADWWALPLGTACAIGFGLVLLPLRLIVDESQNVVDDLNDSNGAKLAAIAVAAGLLAPIFEELVFRGLLLRSLRFLMSDAWAIVVSACLFGAIHLLGDASAGTLVALPALIGLGVVSAFLAIRSGNLSQSILLHIGFNVLAVIGALAS